VSTHEDVPQVSTRAVTGLIGIIVFGQKSQSIIFNIKPKVGVSSAPSEHILVSNRYADADKTAQVENVESLIVTQSRPYWDIDDERLMIRIQSAWIHDINVIGMIGKASKGEWQYFYPCLVSAIVGSGGTDVSHSYFYSRRRSVEQIIDILGTGSELRPVTHSDLVFDSSQLENSYQNVNRIDRNSRNGDANRIILLRIIGGLGLMISGCLIVIPAADALCENRVGISQILEVGLFVAMFATGEFLLIWNLARLLAENS